MPENQKRSEHTFWEHVFILRRYLFISFLSVIAGAGVVHYFHQQVIEFLFRPLGGVQAIFLSPIDPFIFIFKIDFFGGLILALPVIIFCAFLFAAPALNTKKMSVLALFFVLALLLIAGAIFYTFVLLLPLSLSFLLSISVPGIENSFTAQNYLNFMLVQLYMSIGVSFIPLITIVATLIHILNPYQVGGKRGMLYLAITILLAFLTPTTDLYTLLILLVPALGLFEISILVAKVIYSMQHRQS